jgi:RNA polymerase sigma factor (sigma-70 family)
MPTGPMRGVLRHLRRASTLGESAELTDGQLLDRFLTLRDEAAFEALLRRHGPMVLGVCRRVLGGSHDAEDAFQATFLVLVRKARTIHPRELVGHWLYGVAYRTALRAKSAAAQRRAKERQVPPMPAWEDPAEDGWRDVQPLLDRELSALPEKYRLPIVLCDLQGKSRKEAAGQLDWPEGTLSCRLARGRALLARRLGRHGISLGATTLALGLAREVAGSVPAALASATTRTALAGAAPAGVTALAEGVLKAMLWTRLKVGAALLLALAIVVSGAGVLRSRAEAQDGTSAPTQAAQGARTGNRPAKPHVALGNDNLQEWTLDFRFHDPRPVQVDLPGKGPTIVWYLRYEVTNRTPAARRFIPQFELWLPDQARSVNDEVLPPAQKVIERLDDPTQRLKLMNSVTAAAEPIAAPPADGSPHSVQGLAIWQGVPPEAKRFTVFVSGLTNGLMVVDRSGSIPPAASELRRKVLQLAFKRHGDRMVFVPPAVWIYRMAQVLPKPPPRTMEQEKAQRELYFKALSEAQAELERAASMALRKEALKRALRQVELGLRELRDQFADPKAEEDALAEVERIAKEFRRQRAQQSKELEKLQGLWLLKKLELAGGPVPPELALAPLTSPSAVAILGDRFLTRASKQVEKLPRIRVYAETKPHGIDFRIGARIIRGRYELQGDTLRIWIGDGSKRPAEYSPREGHTLLMYQRRKL